MDDIARGVDVDAAAQAGLCARREIRAGRIAGSTAGLAPGNIQANIVILPADVAEDFARFCRANPRACPLLATSQPGDPGLAALGRDIDMRHDLPGYRVFRGGIMTGEVAEVADLWRDDLVTFAIGCSFTFEAALMAEGMRLRHIEEERLVPMYRTNRATVTVGAFGGPLVVSMRPFKPHEASRAEAITARFPDMHGAPVHRGDVSALGIQDLARPDYGEAVTLRPGEEPVFWACGVTSQVAVETAKLPFFLAHAPGKMLVTDHRHPAS